MKHNQLLEIKWQGEWSKNLGNTIAKQRQSMIFYCSLISGFVNAMEHDFRIILLRKYENTEDKIFQ